MKRSLTLLVTLVLFIAFAAPVVQADSSNNLLKGVGKKKSRRPSMSLLLRDDLKAEFQAIWEAYLAEDKDDYLSHFADKLTMDARTLVGKRAASTKADLDKRVTREFKLQDFTKVQFEECFDLRSPNMVFVISEEMMHDHIPVWGFMIEPKQIRKYMKPGDYLVIANTLPDVFDKVSMPSTVYLIFRKIGDKYLVVGMD